MSDQTEDGGPAFPCPSGYARVHEGPVDKTVRVCESGMTLRDYFAGQALAGFLADGNSRPGWDLAYESYAQAGAMLAERGKKP